MFAVALGDFGDDRACEEAAARRIQAHYRVRKVRQVHQRAAALQAVEDAPASPQASGSHEDPAPARLLHRGSHVSHGSHASVAWDPAPDRENHLTVPTVRPTKSFLSCMTAEDYHRIQGELRDQQSPWPGWLQKYRVVVYLLLEEPRSSRNAQVVHLVILFCVLLSIVTFMLETMPELEHVDPEIWLHFEIGCIVVFTGEYLLRLLVCDVGGASVWKFFRGPMNLVDFLAILPFYVGQCVQKLNLAKAFSIVRTVRLVRLFRICKLSRYSSGLQLMIIAVKQSSQALWVLSFFLGIGTVLFSSAIYYVEKVGCPDRITLAQTLLSDGSNRTQLAHYDEECHARPGVTNEYGLCCNENEAPLDFPSIIEAFWWSLVTMTTVGFGDVGPKTSMGKMVGTVTMLSGILLIALPIAIIGRKFQEAYEAAEAKPKESMHPKYKGGPLSMEEMGRQLKLMNMPDTDLASLAREMADDLEEVSSLSKEMHSMQTFESTKQLQVMEHFGVVVDQFLHLSQPSRPTAALLFTDALQGKASPSSQHSNGFKVRPSTSSQHTSSSQGRASMSRAHTFHRPR